jgi:hypothetical protein
VRLGARRIACGTLHITRKGSEIMNEQRSKTAELISSIKQQRDELKLKMHLATADAADEWSKLEEKFHRMMSDYEPVRHAINESAADVWESLKLVANELKEGFHRICQSF